MCLLDDEIKESDAQLPSISAVAMAVVPFVRLLMPMTTRDMCYLEAISQSLISGMFLFETRQSPSVMQMYFSATVQR
jgi:hypothetical protein